MVSLQRLNQSTVSTAMIAKAMHDNDDCTRGTARQPLFVI
jgi:hypothetical protein